MLNTVIIYHLNAANYTTDETHHKKPKKKHKFISSTTHFSELNSTLASFIIRMQQLYDRQKISQKGKVHLNMKSAVNFSLEKLNGTIY